MQSARRHLRQEHAYVVVRTESFFMIENSPLSGEFQKGEAYSCQKEALLCYKKVVLTSVVAKESDNG